MQHVDSCPIKIFCLKSNVRVNGRNERCAKKILNYYLFPGYFHSPDSFIIISSSVSVVRGNGGVYSGSVSVATWLSGEIPWLLTHRWGAWRDRPIREELRERRRQAREARDALMTGTDLKQNRWPWHSTIEYSITTNLEGDATRLVTRLFF